MHTIVSRPTTNHGNCLKSMCKVIMEIIETDGYDVDDVVKVIVENLEGLQKPGCSSTMPSNPIMFISRFLNPIIGLVPFSNPVKMRTKECRQGGRLPKSSSRFHSCKEIITTKVISSNLGNAHCVDEWDTVIGVVVKEIVLVLPLQFQNTS